MQEMNLHQHIPLDAFGHYDIFVNVWASDYQCDKPYPLRYYEQISQRKSLHSSQILLPGLTNLLASLACYIWETVKFSLDMSIIKKKITHTTKRRTHRKATEKTGNNPVRRSKRIQQAKSAQNGDPACLDEVALPTEDVENNQSGSGSTLRQDSVSEDLISPPDEEGTELTAYYKIDYVFRMNFDGLSVDYKFYCPSIGYSKEGVIDLPDKFGFVGSELEAFTG